MAVPSTLARLAPSLKCPTVEAFLFAPEADSTALA
jgi:hypothetical protein